MLTRWNDPQYVQPQQPRRFVAQPALADFAGMDTGTLVLLIGGVAVLGYLFYQAEQKRKASLTPAQRDFEHKVDTITNAVWWLR